MNIIDIFQTALLLVVLALLIKKTNNNTQTSTSKSKKMILDSCGLIDGRIMEIVSAGFSPNQLVIPQFILRELQLLADGGDTHKRARARFGLDVAKRLQESNLCDVVVNRDDFSDIKTTDDKIIALAQKISADLYTTDYNLGKVAKVEGVNVLNVNELAMTMRPVALPGEKKKVKILQKGSNKNQGVGYLEDGTMVVVDNARNRVGSTVDVEVVRYHQTESGKMLFASLVEQAKPSSHKKPKTAKRMPKSEAASLLGIDSK